MPTIRQQFQAKSKKSSYPLTMRKIKTMKVTKTVPVPKMKDTTKAGVLAVVRKMLAKNIENKHIGSAVEEDVQHNSAIGSADCKPLVPEISPIDSTAGTTACQRIGDRIKPKSLTVSGVVSLNPAYYPNSHGDIYVRVLIASQKDIKVGSRIVSGDVDAGNLLKPSYPGLSTETTAFDGETLDLAYPYNTDKFRIYYSKTFKLSLAKEDSVEQWARNSFRWSYTFKDLPANFTYDEANGDWPNNFAPFFAIGYAYGDGSSPDVATLKLISNTYSLLAYEDA